MTRPLSFGIAVFCALILSASSPAAEIPLSLNLEFNDASDFGSGGIWTVVAKADERGIAGIVLYFQQHTLNFDPLTGFLTPAGFEVEQSAVFGFCLEMVQGDDLTDPTLDVGVIGGTYPSTYVDDANLTLFGANPDLGSFTGGVELATGSFDPGDVPNWCVTSANAGNMFLDATGTVGAADDVFATIRFVVPEPTTLFLLGLGLTLTLATRRRS